MSNNQNKISAQGAVELHEEAMDEAHGGLAGAIYVKIDFTPALPVAKPGDGSVKPILGVPVIKLP